MSVTVQTGQRDSADMQRHQAPDRCEALWSDCWPDCSDRVQDPDVVDATARRNAPRIVLGEIGRVLAVILIAIATIEFALNAYQIH